MSKPSSRRRRGIGVIGGGFVAAALVFASPGQAQSQFSIPSLPVYQTPPQQQKQLTELLRQGKEAVDRGNLNQAIAIYEQATNLDTDNAELYGGMGYLHVRQEQYPQAIAAFQQALALDPNNPEYYDGLGYSYAHNNQLSEATSAYSTAINLAPRAVKYYLGLGVVLLAQRDYERVRQVFDEISRIEPGNADAVVMMGAALLKSGQFDQVVAFNQEALVYHPDRSELYLQLGTAHLKQGNLVAARQVLEPRLNRDWRNLTLWLTWASLMEAEQNYPAALDAYKKAQRIDSQAIAAKIGAGRMYLAVNEPREAVWIFRDLTQLDPQNGDFHYFLGEAYLVEGKKDLATKAMEKAGELYQLEKNMSGEERVERRLTEI